MSTRSLAVLHRAQLLALPHPAIQVGELDAIDLAEQVAGKRVDTHARILAPFVMHPGVSGMEAIALRDFETCCLDHFWYAHFLEWRQLY